MDISDAFYQVQLHEDLYPYVTFRVTNLGSFCLTRLPQGYVGGPSIFQAIIENWFPENIGPYLTYYVDDILIMTDTEEKHLEVIGIILYILRQNGMKLKIEKCNICPEQLDFLGITLCKEGVKVKADNCEAIINIKTPQTKRQVRSFLGAIGYYRRYIQNFALIAKPLHKLTWDKVSNSKVSWDESCEIAFQTLKQKLLEAPILGHMNYSWDTVMRTDSSGIGIGATLSQISCLYKSETIIAYYSHALQPHEFNYNITTHKALAVLSSVRHFATYLRFTKFLIKTDYIDLKYIFKFQKTKQESHRLIRWALYLSGFDFTIQFCSGNSPKIHMSDFLSWYAYEDQVKEVGSLACSFTVDELERLEADCVDFRTQSTTKIAEEQLPIIPNVEQMIK